MSEHRDPAVEAAQRAWEMDREPDDVRRTFNQVSDGNFVKKLTVAAAREMAAPIRALHKPSEGCGNTSHTNPSAMCPECALVCGHCGLDWPCDTARLIYPESELP